MGTASHDNDANDNLATRPSLLLRVRDHHDSAAWERFVKAYTPIVFGFCRKRGLQAADRCREGLDAGQMRAVGAGASRELGMTVEHQRRAGRLHDIGEDLHPIGEFALARGFESQQHRREIGRTERGTKRTGKTVGIADRRGHEIKPRGGVLVWSLWRCGHGASDAISMGRKWEGRQLPPLLRTFKAELAHQGAPFLALGLDIGDLAFKRRNIQRDKTHVRDFFAHLGGFHDPLHLGMQRSDDAGRGAAGLCP